MSSRRQVSPSRALEQIDEIQSYHEQGKESLKLTAKTSVREQAEDLDWSETTLRKARQFARPNTGYSRDRLDELCDLLEEYRPVFGTSHIGLLVTVDWPEREKLQKKCIKNNWSFQELRTAILKLKPRESSGGRHRKVNIRNALVRLEQLTTALDRMHALLWRSRDGKKPIIYKLSNKVQVRVAALNMAAIHLRIQIHKELAEMREGQS